MPQADDLDEQEDDDMTSMMQWPREDHHFSQNVAAIEQGKDVQSLQGCNGVERISVACTQNQAANIAPNDALGISSSVPSETDLLSIQSRCT